MILRFPVGTRAFLLAALAAACSSGPRPPQPGPIPAAAVAASIPAATIATASSPESTYGRTFTRLSEPAGFFPSENVVSNETSYLHVLDAMRRVGATGGAYIGVGPDQNFSYIAATRPAVAFMFDIRRDAMIEHQLFKAVFSMARNRLEYLCILLAKPCPADIDAWTHRPVADIVDYIDRTAASADIARASQVALDRRAKALGIPLDTNDLFAFSVYRAAFIRHGLDVQYSSIDNNFMTNMPVWRDLIVEVDRAGNQLNYLAADSLFQIVRKMQAEDRIIPVTGNAAGPKALRAIGEEVRARGLAVSAIYMSNVEQYLWRDGGFSLFVENVRTLPRTPKSVFIRSMFRSGAGFGYHPLSVPGYNSTQLLQYVDTFLFEWDAGRMRSYRELLDHGYISPP